MSGHIHVISLQSKPDGLTVERVYAVVSLVTLNISCTHYNGDTEFSFGWIGSFSEYCDVSLSGC